MKTRRTQFVAAILVLVAILSLSSRLALADRLQPQVKIEARMIMVSHDDARQLGFDTNLAKAFAQLPQDSSTPTASGLGFGANPSPNVIGAHFFPGNNAPGTLDLSGILSGPQMQSVLDALNREKGAKIISPLSILTPSNEAAGFNISPGVQLIVRPRIVGDGTTIEMMIVPQETNPVSVNSGQTLLFGGYVPKKESPKNVSIGSVPLMGTLMRKGGEAKTDLILFITPQRVDALSHSPGGYQNGDPIKTETTGTGETIGHIADLQIQNMTDQPHDFVIPPLVLESKSGKNQTSASPHTADVSLAAHETKTVPLDGICLEQKKPAVGKGVTGDLIMNTGDSGSGQNSDVRIPPDKVKEALRTERAIYRAVDDSAKQDLYKNFPYSDKEEQKRIALQWGTWTNLQIAHITGGSPATKDDMKDVVKKQLHGPTSAATEKKIDKGIDTIFEKVELTTSKAKDLEEPPSEANAKQNVTFQDLAAYDSIAL